MEIWSKLKKEQLPTSHARAVAEGIFKGPKFLEIFNESEINKQKICEDQDQEGLTPKAKIFLPVPGQRRELKEKTAILCIILRQP